jgi:hypothetical protein
MANETESNSRKPRRWLRWLGIIFGGIIVLLALAYFAGSSEWALKSIILPRVGASMNAIVTVDSASISPFSAVNIRGLKVRTTGDDPLVTARTVRARYSLIDIIKGNINVTEVTLDSPVVNLVMHADGTSNLDPLTKGKDKETKPKQPKRERKSGKAPQLNLQKFALNNATVRKIDERKDGTRQSLELTGVNITAENLGNNKTGKLGLTANAHLDQGLKSASNGVLNVKIGGNFQVALDAALKPVNVAGQSQADVNEARGAFQQAAGLGVLVNTELTPAELKDASVRFGQNGKALGAITVSGPFNAETMEGRLAVRVSQIDRQLLNLAGAASGIDFNQTTFNSTNTLELAQRGRVIQLNGESVVANFSATLKGQTTPTLDLRNIYAVTYDRSNQTALIQNLALTGMQNGAEFLRGTLAKPMLVNLGKGANAGEESTFDLVMTNFNLPDWRAFLGTNVNLASGKVGMNLRVISQEAGKQLLLAGNIRVDDITGVVQSNRFDRLATLVGVDVAMRGPAVEIRKLSGSLQQSGQPGGAFEVSGNYHLTNKAGHITARLTDLNQNVLKSFLASALGEKQLESIVINATTTAKLDGPADMAVKAELHVANLIVNDPSGQIPKSPLAADTAVDVVMAKQVLDLKNIQLALTKTERAPNVLVVTGRIDMSKSNAWIGNLKVASDGLDVTPYYDLLAGNKNKPAQTNGKRAPQPQPKETKPETEPAPTKLPFMQFTEEINIAKLFLREVVVSNLVSKTTIENGRVNVNPFSLTLNGGAVQLTALLNLAVAGYEYDLNAKVDRVPVEPLVNSFMPEKRGQMKGDLLTAAEIKGAGVAGKSLQKNLVGKVAVTLTNANVNVAQYKWLQKILAPISIALRIPQLSESPLNWVDARADIGGGKVTLPAMLAESSIFRAGVTGTVSLAEIITNSTLNKLPVDIELRRNVADVARLTPPGTPANAQFVRLPRFVSVAGKLGDPKTDIDSIAVTRLLAGAVGNFVGGDVGKVLRGVGNIGGGSTNTGSTNSVGNLIQGLGGLLQKAPKTNTTRTNDTTTNAPAQKKKSDKFKLNDLLK